MRSSLFALLAALPLAAAPGPVAAQEPTGGAKVYKQVIASVAWVHSTRDRGEATGSGTLVDADRRLVLTNYHVVEENNQATVYFPTFRDGGPVTDRQFYTQRAGTLGHRGRVVARDRQADLSLIQLDAIPGGAKAIPLAARSPDPGESVHSVGNPGKSGALWGYVKGTVRQVYHKKWRVELDRRTVTFDARVIETDSPTNPGDSGGPLLNDRGELVGVTQGGAVNAQLVSFFVDVSEVRPLVGNRTDRNAKADKSSAKEAAPAAAKRTAPLPVTDRARLFSPDTLKAADAAVAELSKKGLDVLVETYPAAPAEWLDKAKQAKPEERQRLFREWVAERLKAEKADGVVVLVCLDPRYLLVDVPKKWEERFPPKFAQKLGDDLKKSFGEKKFDEGLTATMKQLREGFTEAKK